MNVVQAFTVLRPDLNSLVPFGVWVQIQEMFLYIYDKRQNLIAPNENEPLFSNKESCLLQVHQS